MSFFFCGLACVDEFVVEDIVKNADVKNLSMLVASVLSYNIEKMSVSKKIFRLSQLIIDFLLHYKKHSSFKLHNKVCFLYFSQIGNKKIITFVLFMYPGRFDGTL